MAEFQMIMHDYVRMCDRYVCDNCAGCPLEEYVDNDEKCSDVIMFKSDVAEEVVMEWALKHPEPVYPTWKEWQASVFPDHDISLLCPRIFMQHECDGLRCEDCDNEHIPPNIAEKLGIKPKEVK